LLATHDLAEASSLCDRVVLLHQGRLVAQGRPADLISATAATLADVVLTISGEPGR
jgi:ABC-type multidrug transport system ATPase subunit